MAIRKAREHVPGRDNLSWGKFLQAAVTKRSLRLDGDALRKSDQSIHRLFVASRLGMTARTVFGGDLLPLHERKESYIHPRHRRGVRDHRSGNTRAAVAHPGDSRRRKDRLKEQIKPEMHQSVVELGTEICDSIDCRRAAHVIELRSRLAELAGRSGLKIASVGTHPFSHWRDPAHH